METHWQKWEAFVAAAKNNATIRVTMRKGSRSEKIQALREYGFTDQEIEALEQDLALVSDSTQVSWWSW